MTLKIVSEYNGRILFHTIIESTKKVKGVEISNEYSVYFDKIHRRFNCSCHNGSNVGINDNQGCKHKKLLKEYLEKKNG